MNKMDILMVELIIPTFLFIVVILGIIKFVNGDYNNTIKQAILVSKEIVLSENTHDCKDANLSLYIWFRKKFGVNPFIQIGKKRVGESLIGHMWLEINGTIFDATDLKFIGAKAKDVYNSGEYILDCSIK